MDFYRRICVKRDNLDCQIGYSRYPELPAYYFSVGRGTAKPSTGGGALGLYGGATDRFGCSSTDVISMKQALSDNGCGESAVSTI